MDKKETEKTARDLILAVRSGDGEAFESLLASYGGMLTSQTASFYSSIASTEPSPSGLSAEDLRQEAQIAFLRAARTYDPDEKGVTFGLYAKICVRNALISLYRKSRTRMKRYQRAGGKKGIAASPSGEAEGVGDYAELLEKAGEGLSAFEKKVLDAHVTGMKPREIAESLGRPVKSVYNALFRMKSKLRKMKE